MAENTLLDGRVPNGILLAKRTLSWANEFPDRTKINDELFLRIDQKTIYKWNGTAWVDLILDETLNINFIVGLI